MFYVLLFACVSCLLVSLLFLLQLLCWLWLWWLLWLFWLLVLVVVVVVVVVVGVVAAGAGGGGACCCCCCCPSSLLSRPDVLTKGSYMGRLACSFCLYLVVADCEDGDGVNDVRLFYQHLMSSKMRVPPCCVNTILTLLRG